METEDDDSVQQAGILDKAEEFFYFDDTLSEAIEKWCRSRCDTFDADPTHMEHSMEHHNLFTEFCELFESIIEGFLTNEGLSPVDFYQEIRRQLDSCRTIKERQSTFANLVLSSIDFNNFCVMMNDVRSGRGFCFCPPLLEVDDEEMDMAADDKWGGDCGEVGAGAGAGDWKRDHHPTEGKSYEYTDEFSAGDKGFK